VVALVIYLTLGTFFVFGFLSGMSATFYMQSRGEI
jgi:hypothetical protein